MTCWGVDELLYVSGSGLPSHCTNDWSEDGYILGVVVRRGLLADPAIGYGYGVGDRSGVAVAVLVLITVDVNVIVSVADGVRVYEPTVGVCILSWGTS